MMNVRALDEDASSQEKQKYKKAWPPVAPGNQFVMFIDDLNQDEYTSERCDVRMEVTTDPKGHCVLRCLESDCENPEFGTQKTSSAYHASLHARSLHLKKMLKIYVAQESARAKKKQKTKPLAGTQQIMNFFPRYSPGDDAGARASEKSLEYGSQWVCRKPPPPPVDAEPGHAESVDNIDFDDNIGRQWETKLMAKIGIEMKQCLLKKLSPALAREVAAELRSSNENDDAFGISVVPCLGVSLQGHVSHPVGLNFPLQLMSTYHIPWAVDTVRERIQHTERCEAWKNQGKDACDTCLGIMGDKRMVRAIKSSKLPIDKMLSFPPACLTENQLAAKRALQREQGNRMKLTMLNMKRQRSRLFGTLEQYKRIQILLSKDEVPRLRQLLAHSIKQGYGVKKIVDQLVRAIDGSYHPRGYTKSDYEDTFLALKYDLPLLFFSRVHSCGFFIPTVSFVGWVAGS